LLFLLPLVLQVTDGAAAVLMTRREALKRGLPVLLALAAVPHLCFRAAIYYAGDSSSCRLDSYAVVAMPAERNTPLLLWLPHILLGCLIFCQVTDGAAAVLMMTRREALKRGLPVLGIFRSFSAVGVDPAIMGVGPAVAIPAAVEKVSWWSSLGVCAVVQPQQLCQLAYAGASLLWAWTQASWEWGQQ
jgi:acetyl-CoA acetyltransferase